MKFALKTLLLLALLAALTVAALAQNKRGPSTPEERTMAVKSARLLEAEPFYKDAKKSREWFTVWLIEVPDISVEICGAYLGPVLGEKKNYASEIFTQMMFSSAAFLIAHPDQAKDRIAVNLAGLEGALKTYEAIIKEKPKAKWEYLDGLLTKRDRGELRLYVEDITQTKCQAKRN